MKRNIATLLASLVLLISGLAVSAGPAYAATHDAPRHMSPLITTGHMVPLISKVPCLPSFSKVGLQNSANNGWVCYGNSAGSAPVGFNVEAIHPDDWSGFVTLSDGVTTIPFCNHVWETISPPAPVISIFLSPTLEPWC